MKYHYISQELLLYKNNSERGFFKGYASVFNVKDGAGDIILPGAFADSLRENPDIKLLWQHEQKEPIGFIIDIKEDLKGLHIEGKFLLALQRAKEAYTLVVSGVIRGLSIGYLIEDYLIENHARYLIKLKLLEVSLVTFPANKLAEVSFVKGGGEIFALQRSLDRANKVLLEKDEEVFGGRY